MSKKIKTLIIILIILIIIVAAILVILMVKQKNETINENKSIESTNENVSQKNKLSKIEEKYEYFDVQTCVNNYIKVLKNLNEDTYKKYVVDEKTKQEMQEYIKEQEEALYNQLGIDYKNLLSLP